MSEGHRRELVVVGAAVILATLGLCARPEPPREPVAITKTADSLEATKPAFDSAAIADAAAREASRKEQLRLQHQEQQLRAIAEAHRRRADSLAAIARITMPLEPSNNPVLLAYEARTAEASTLRAELETARARIDSLQADTARLYQAWLRSEARRLALEKFNADLRVALHKATECTIAFGIRCPTRTETAVGVLAGVGAIKLASALTK